MVDITVSMGQSSVFFNYVTTISHLNVFINILFHHKYDICHKRKQKESESQEISEKNESKKILFVLDMIKNEEW